VTTPGHGRRRALRALLFVPWALAANAQKDERPRLVAAMRLAVLAERAAKLHVQVARGVLADRSRRAMAEVVREFEATRRSAAERLPDPEARDNYLLLRLLWADFRPWAERAPSRDSVRQVADRVEEIAWIATKGARLLHPGSSDSLAMRASLACVLSQRVPRLLLMHRQAPGEPGRDTAEAFAALNALLEQLAGAPLNTPETRSQALIAQAQMGFLERAAHALGSGAQTARDAEVAAKAGDHILEVMERAAARYDAAGI